MPSSPETGSALPSGVSPVPRGSLPGNCSGVFGLHAHEAAGLDAVLVGGVGVQTGVRVCAAVLPAAVVAAIADRDVLEVVLDAAAGVLCLGRHHGDGGRACRIGDRGPLHRIGSRYRPVIPAESGRSLWLSEHR